MYMLKIKKLKSTQNCLWYGLMKIWFILGHSKVHNFFLVNLFLASFLHICSFCFNLSYISPYNISQIKLIHKKHVYRGTNNKLIHIFQLQKSITIYLVYICCNYFYKCLILQVENLNLATNLEHYCFMSC
jgi:hypothetical protein